jgi:dCTP deaminase
LQGFVSFNEGIEMIFGYETLCEMVKSGIIENVDPDNINGASIDLTLDNTIFIENSNTAFTQVDLAARPRQFPGFVEYIMKEEGFLIPPGMFLLASTRQIFNLPNNVAFNYRLNSSLGRAGLNHALAGFADPGWTGSHLTLEFKNWTEYHHLRIRPGMKCGQAIFYEVEPVPENRLYATIGSYNYSKGVTLR